MCGCARVSDFSFLVVFSQCERPGPNERGVIQMAANYTTCLCQLCVGALCA